MNKTVIMIGGIAFNLGIFFDTGDAVTTLITSGLTLIAIGVIYMMDSSSW